MFVSFISSASVLRPLWVAAPVAAMAYPLPLVAFHRAEVAIEGGTGPVAWAVAALSLALAFAVVQIGGWNRLMIASRTPAQAP